MKKSVLLVEGGLDNKFLSTIAFKMYKNVTPVFVRDFPKFCLKYNLTHQIVVVKNGWLKDTICISIIGSEENTDKAYREIKNMVRYVI